MSGKDKTKEPTVCGVVMPISSISDCDEGHWLDVKKIIFEAIEEAGFAPNLVSDADDVGIIQKRIIQNLYDNPIVVCDVSGKNPNVMFELGMRLAFDKPTIIVKDDKTTYSFDTSPIEHIGYPRDLRFSKIVEFKASLAGKIAATHKHAVENANSVSFLKSFGEFTVAKIDEKEVSGQEYIIEELRSIRNGLNRLDRANRTADEGGQTSPFQHLTVRFSVTGCSEEEIISTIKLYSGHPSFMHYKVVPISEDCYEVLLRVRRDMDGSYLIEAFRSSFPAPAQVRLLRSGLKTD